MGQPLGNLSALIGSRICHDLISPIGAIGNGLDRWRLGRVVDLFEFLPVSFPVFNVADIAINLAVLCLALDLLHQRFRPLR